MKTKRSQKAPSRAAGRVPAADAWPRCGTVMAERRSALKHRRRSAVALSPRSPVPRSLSVISSPIYVLEHILAGVSFISGGF
jgi:hypothetical protein